MLDSLWPWMHLGARLLFALSVMITSLGHFTTPDTFAGYAAAKGVPSPKAAVLLSGLMMWSGALLVALGWHRFIGAGLVILFLVPVSLKMHAYWNQPDPAIRQNDKFIFWRNVGLIGGALFFATYARWEWPMSLGG